MILQTVALLDLLSLYIVSYELKESTDISIKRESYSLIGFYVDFTTSAYFSQTGKSNRSYTPYYLTTLILYSTLSENVEIDQARNCIRLNINIKQF